MTPAMRQNLAMLMPSFDELQALVSNAVQTNPFISFPHDLASPVPPHRLASNRGLRSSELEPESDESKSESDEDVPPFSFEMPRNVAVAREEGWLEALAGDDPFASLEEHLRLQIGCLHLREPLARACGVIIDHLDGNGWLATDLGALAVESGIGEERLESALAVIRSLDPPGVGARSIEECLILQLDPDDPGYSLACELIACDLHGLGHGDLGSLAARHGVVEGEVAACVETIRGLDPHPASGFGPDETRFSVPDIIIAEDADGLVVTVAGDDLERLKIDDEYLEMVTNASADAVDRLWMDERRGEAERLIDAIAFRNKTLRTFARWLAVTQGPFLRKGEALRPMTMQQAADEMELSVSTISRLVNGKTILTPRGVIPLKDFFVRGYEGRGGSEVSSDKVKRLIKLFVDAEDRWHPLSDGDLAERIRLQTGATVARRTIAKYRGQLGIPNQASRRERC